MKYILYIQIKKKNIVKLTSHQNFDKESFRSFTNEGIKYVRNIKTHCIYKLSNLHEPVGIYNPKEKYVEIFMR